ncbi:glycosyltransferase family 2 protein [Zhongshania sp.]|jgi:glycosyltransferase involved in cell wall biosynthesis|uniref:glycosyltransferase family 2 protein n=1 Tax=Zhongshania sp. TaxID=1971902 RepID=UPI001B544EE9|nr:glycosyltransferase family 2 protein [Zhongshania sp.]MBQ0797302.1 glycosyltransferase family 2 protein [Zhongshania sp.]
MCQSEISSSLSFVVPAKNEDSSIAAVVGQIVERYPQAEVIVVNDGSDDDTARLAESAGAKVISHPYSKGNGASVKAGARAASNEIIIFMDGDGQHNPADAERLLAALAAGYDMVVGARNRDSQASVGRATANGFYNSLASFMTGHQVADLTSGYRAVRADKFKEFLYLLPNGFSYPTTSTMAFFRAGYSVAYEPIVAAKREGKSHLKPWKDGMRFLIIIFKIGTLYSPLKLFVPLAALFFLSGAAWYGYTFVTLGRFTNMSALLLTGSVVVFMMGLISEQITALMYKDSN